MGVFGRTFGRNYSYNRSVTSSQSPEISGDELYYLENKMVGLALLVNAKGSTTTTQLEYGSSPSLTGATVVEGDDVVGSVDTIVGFITARLTPGKYYYRVTATNSHGTTTGDILPFEVYTGVGITLTDYTPLLSEGIAAMDGTTYYIDPSAETNGDGLSSETPFDSWTRLATIGGSNKYLQKRGTTYNAATGVFRNIDGPCYVGVYGTGEDKAYITAGTNTNSTFIGANYRLIIENYDIQGYRSGGDGTEVGRGIRFGATSSGATMNHIVHNCRVHGFEYGIDSYLAGGYFRGLYILHNEVYDISLDGMYPTSATDIEIAHNYIYDVNTAWFINEDDGYSSVEVLSIVL